MSQFFTVNPYTQEKIKTYDYTSWVQAQADVQCLSKTQKKWTQLNIEERFEALKKITSQIEHEKEQWAKMATLEMGKPIAQSRLEVEKCILALKEIPKLAQKELVVSVQKLSNGNFHIVPSDYGVVFSIQPWNFPFWQVLRMAVCAWMTGHTILLKHSDRVAGCAQLIEDVCEWQNEKILKVVHLEVSHIHRLIETSADVGLVTFTGSTDVGQKIAETCGRALKKTILELGGNDAYIVMPDADINKAAGDCVASRTINSGQSCVSVKRIYLHQSIKSSFLASFEKNLKSKLIGDPNQFQTQIGPLANSQFVQKWQEQLQLAKKMGAKWKEVIHKQAPFVSLGYLDFDHQLRAFESEEIFAPIACIYEFTDLSFVIDAVNQGPFGLAGGVFTSDPKVINRVAREMRVGTFAINTYSQSHPLLPFGGTKKSGIGREMGIAGLHEFVLWKVVGGAGF